MLLTLALTACTASKPTDDTGSAPPVGPYSVDIRTDGWGIPHILADDHGSLGYGMGYAFARDHACVLADQVLMVRSERSKYLGAGPDGLYTNQDFGWLGLGVMENARAGFGTLDPRVQDTIVGYAAGYDRYIAEHADDLPAACRGAAWVKPIDHIDLLAYYLALALNGSGAVFVDAVGSATPPSTAAAMPTPPLSLLTHARNPPIGSNGWALGADKAADGTAMLLSNTHFPSEGQLQWHESQLTIPGEMDVYGASLMGVPVINVGFNHDVAWTHTVSNTPRFNLVLLTLDPSNPLRYQYDGGYRDIATHDYSIDVLQSDGSTRTETRTLYDSDWGPIINAPALGWNSLYAVALKDANEDDLDVAGAWLGLDTSTSLDDIETALADHGGTPWVHILAADKTGEILYADPGSTPNWSAAAEARYPAWLAEQPVAALFDQYGAPTVDGSDPTFEWVEEAGSRVPGLVPYARAPRVRRTDYVINANDNHWMPNPDAPLEGYPYLYGPERAPISARTRMNLRLAGETGAGSASGDDGRFTLDELEGAVLGGRGSIQEVLRPSIVERCRTADSVLLTSGLGAGETVDITHACDVLADWDGTVRVDAVGAALWREVLGSGEYGWEDTLDAGALYATAFDPDDPVHTPRDLVPAPESGDDPVLQAIAHGVWILESNGFAIDAPLSELQFLRKGGVDHPVPGGTYYEGVIEIAAYDTGNATLLPREERAAVLNDLSGLTADGYQMNDGDSFVLAAELSAEGPRARALLTYSESEDPTSPHYDDQTERFGDEQLRPVLFEEADIEADPALDTLHLDLE